MKMSNEDRWLIERWEKVRQMEEAMDKARENFKALQGEIHKKVKEAHPELNRMDIHWRPNEIESYGGNIIFSKESWPYNWENWRNGIYIERSSLDELSSKSVSEPDIYIFIQVKKGDSRIEKFRERISNEAKKILKNNVEKWSTEDEWDNRTLLWYTIPEGKKKLLQMIQDSHEQEFVDCIANHVGIMAGFIPVMDELFSQI